MRFVRKYIQSTADNDAVGCCGEKIGSFSVNQLDFELSCPKRTLWTSGWLQIGYGNGQSGSSESQEWRIISVGWDIPGTSSLAICSNSTLFFPMHQVAQRLIQITFLYLQRGRILYAFEILLQHLTNLTVKNFFLLPNSNWPCYFCPLSLIVLLCKGKACFIPHAFVVQRKSLF